MGRRGTKPIPSALHVLRGNPSKQPINTREPKHAALDATELPDEIAGDAVATAEWRRIAPVLVVSGVLTVGDRATLIAYCQKYADWQAQEKLVRADGIMQRSKRGAMMVHPAARLANQTFLLWLRAAVEMGLTPSSRSRIIAGALPAPVSKWHGALK